MEGKKSGMLSEVDPEVYIKHLEETRKVIQEVELEEYKESIDSIDAIKNRIETDRSITNLKKQQFISEIKSGLGEEIKSEPNKIEYIEKPLLVRVRNFFKKLFKTI
jgi:DNA-binding protein H-NS